MFSFTGYNDTKICVDFTTKEEFVELANPVGYYNIQADWLGELAISTIGKTEMDSEHCNIDSIVKVIELANSLEDNVENYFKWHSQLYIESNVIVLETTLLSFVKSNLIENGLIQDTLIMYFDIFRYMTDAGIYSVWTEFNYEGKTYIGKVD